jgi:hypothetical protein
VIAGNDADLATLSPVVLSSYLTEASWGIAKTSVRDRCGVLRVFLRYVHREGLAPRDWSAIIEVPQVHRLSGIPRAVTWDEVRRILDTPPNHRVSTNRGNFTAYGWRTATEAGAQAAADRREAGCCASERSERGTATRLAPHLTGQRSRHTEQWIPEIVLGFECGGRPGHRDACEAVGRWRGSYHDRTAPRARPSPVAAPSSNAAVAGRRLPSFREVMFPGRRLGFVVVAAERSIRSRTSTRRCPDLPAHYL